MLSPGVDNSTLPADGESVLSGRSHAATTAEVLRELVAAEFPGCEVSVGTSAGDNRSYRVNFDKIHRELPGFECRHTARSGARQLREVFDRIQMSPDTYQFRAFTRLKQLKYLQTTQQVDAELRWC